MAGPLVTNAGWKFGGKAFHLGDSRTGRISRCWRTRNTDGRITIVADDLRRTLLPLRDGKRAERHHAAAGIAHVQLQQILDLKTVTVLRLNDDALHASSIWKVVDVGRSKVGGNGVVDIGEGDAERVGFLAIDHQHDLRSIRQAFDTHASKYRALACLLHQFASRSRKSGLANAIAVLQAEGEAAGCTEAFNGRWRKGKRRRVFQAKQLHVGAVGDVLRRVVGPTFAPVLQGNEGQRCVGTVAGEAEALNCNDILYRRFVLEDFLDLFDGGNRAVGTGFRWSLNVNDQEALILIRHEGAGKADEEITETGDQREVDDHHSPRTTGTARCRLGIAIRQAIELPVEPAAQTALFLMALLDGLEERGAKSRCQRQCEEGGEQNGHDHRQAELTIDDAGRSREESHGYEHAGQNQRDAENGTGDLLHGLLGCSFRRQAFFGHDALDVLNDDDGIIHQNTDGEHHGKHGQNVDGKPGGIHDRAGAQQRHRHNQRGNDRVAEILQEDEHHDEDENDGLDQRVQHFFDGCRNEGAGVIGNGVGNAAWKEAR